MKSDWIERSLLGAIAGGLAVAAAAILHHAETSIAAFSLLF